MWHDVLVTFLRHAVEISLPRERIDLARRGAWSAAIRHAPRALGGAVVTKGRAQLIKETFCMGVILTLAIGHRSVRAGALDAQIGAQNPQLVGSQAPRPL